MFRESEQDLISATAVCKHWRRTFISTPILWNKIVCSERENLRVVTPRVQAYLDRSGSVPVDVQIHARASQLLSSHTGRILSLRMFLRPPLDLDRVAEYLSDPAPTLKTVTLHVKNWGRSVLVLPPTFFEGLLSSVRTLTIHGPTLSPGPCNLSQLTKFTLITHPRASVPSAVLLDTLERMPLLQLFEHKTNRHDIVPIDRVVTLPRLEEITITVDFFSAGGASSILPALCLPSARRVLMRSTVAPRAFLTPILPHSFEERLPGLSATPEVSATLGKGFDIGFFGLDQSQLTLSTNSAMVFTRFPFGGAPLGSVRKLHVCFPRSSAAYSKSFVTMIQTMTGLERLEVVQNTGGPLAYWAGVDDQTEICPTLDTLVVTDADIKEVKRYVRVLKQARERAGVPIAHVETGDQWGPDSDGDYCLSSIFCDT